MPAAIVAGTLTIGSMGDSLLIFPGLVWGATPHIAPLLLTCQVVRCYAFGYHRGPSRRRSKDRRELTIVALRVKSVSRCKLTGPGKVLKTCFECE
jgi:hypothetical protein